LIKNPQPFGKKFQKTVGGIFFDSHCIVNDLFELRSESCTRGHQYNIFNITLSVLFFPILVFLWASCWHLQHLTSKQSWFFFSCQV